MRETSGEFDQHGDVIQHTVRFVYNRGERYEPLPMETLPHNFNLGPRCVFCGESAPNSEPCKRPDLWPEAGRAE